MEYRMTKMMRIGDRKHQHEPPRRALLALVLAGPIDLVARGQLHLFVDLSNRLFDGAAEIAVANAVLDGNIALTALAVDLFGAVFGLDRGELGERDALAAEGRAGEYCRWLPGCRGTAGGSGRQRRSGPHPVQDLGDGVATDSGLDGVLDVGNVDAIACGSFAIDE